MAGTTKLLTSDFNDVTDSNPLPTKLNGSYIQYSDPISSDTIVTVGSSVTLKNGSVPFEAVGKYITSAARIATSVKWKLQAVFYAESNTSLAVAYSVLKDASSTASTNGGGQVAAITKKYTLELSNADVSDITVKLITRGEAH